MLRNDLTGRKFGELEVLAFVGYINKKSRYKVKCSCGREQISAYQDLLLGSTERCMVCHRNNKSNRFRHICLERRRLRGLPTERPTEFGPTSLRVPGGPLRREYDSWRGMIQRCYNSKAKDFKDYGAKGVKVCDAWLYSFLQFVADVGARPVGKTLDRYPNPAGNYEPGNVRWANALEQRHNHRPKAKRVQSVQTNELVAA